MGCWPAVDIRWRPTIRFPDDNDSEGWWSTEKGRKKKKKKGKEMKNVSFFFFFFMFTLDLLVFY